MTTPDPLARFRIDEEHLKKLQDDKWLGDQIESYLGDGSRYGVQTVYSYETEQALETGGGIYKALPLLKDVSDAEAPFIVTNADVWSDYNYASLPKRLTGLAHLVMVDNPSQHPDGDFALNAGLLSDAGDLRLTFSGIGIYSPALFSDTTETIFPLAPLLRTAMGDGLVSGEHYQGKWFDIGTPERLQSLDSSLVGAKHG